MVMSIKAVIDTSSMLTMFNTILPTRAQRAMKKAAARAAYRIQEMMRDELDRMIYSQPESPNYIRTYTLRRSTYAARPGADHSNDHDAAFAGQDLAIDPAQGTGFVKMSGYEFESEIGAWANYAMFVHEGFGLGHRIPKPFTVRPLAEAPKILNAEIGQALAAENRGT